MNYDKVLDEIGELGRWQLLALFLLAFFAASNGVDNTFNVFTGYEPDSFMCRVKGCSNETDYSSLVQHDEIFGKKQDGGVDHCKIHPLRHNYYQPGGELCTNTSFDLSLRPVGPPKYCGDHEDVVYAPFAMKQTFVTEFGLICND